MKLLDPILVTNRLRELKSKRPLTFGISEHGLELNPVLPEAVVLAFEQKHDVELPIEYRHFLTQVGNGGAGPYYGIFPLGTMDENDDEPQPWPDGGLVGTLSVPFPLRTEWNDLSSYPPDELDPEAPEFDRQMEIFDNTYFSSSIVNGAIPLCHMGCALRIWLVVTGEQVGRLWRDRRAEYKGLSPVVLHDNSPATFTAWYEEWLQNPIPAP